MDFDIDSLSDDDLNARIAEARNPTEQPPEEEAPPPPEPADSPPAPEPAPVAPPEPQGEPGQPTRDRGDLSVALQQERDRRRQIEAVLQDPALLAQYAAQMGLQIAQPQQQAQEQPEFLDEALAQYTQQQMQGMQGQVSQQMQQMRNQMSVELAKLSIPDWQETIDAFLKLQDDPEMAPVLQALDASVMNSPNPAMALYRHAKRFNATQAPAVDVQAEAKKMAETMVAEALAKQKDPLKGPHGVARAGSVTPGVPAQKHPSQMTDAELDEAAAASRRSFFK